MTSSPGADSASTTLERVEALEAKYETQRLATLEWGKDVDKLMRWIDDHLKRIMALEQQPSAPAPAGGLVMRVAKAIHPSVCADPSLYMHEARAAIREVAAWLDSNEGDSL